MDGDLAAVTHADLPIRLDYYSVFCVAILPINVWQIAVSAELCGPLIKQHFVWAAYHSSAS